MLSVLQATTVVAPQAQPQYLRTMQSKRGTGGLTMAELVEVLEQISDWMMAIFFVLLAIEVVLIVGNTGGRK